jgi:hypothetical protein
MQSLAFSCDTRLWQRFLTACKARDESPDAVLRDLIRLEAQRVERRQARSDEVIDERLLGRLRLLVAEVLVEARSWRDMQQGLAQRGLRHVAAGGGLNLIGIKTGRVLCKGSQVGPGYLELVRRFGAGFPGHPRPGLAAQVLAGQANPAEASTCRTESAVLSTISCSSASVQL